MKKGDSQLARPQVLYKGTKASIEALTGIVEGSIAYATNTDELGTYDGAAWNWGSGGGGAAWGAITGTLSDQTDLQSELDAKISHALATAANDFLVASGIGVFVKKTLAEVKTILGLGSAAYTASTDYAPSAKGVTNGDIHDHVGGDGAPITEAAITLADNTTNDASTSKHGLLKKLSNVASQFMNGVGSWVAIDHSSNVSNVGTNSHATIDTHLASTSNPHSVTAAQAVAIPESGWIEVAATWTRTGNYTFTVSGDVTATYRKGVKVRYKDSGSGSNYEYGVILSSAYGAPNTTVTLFTNDDYAMAAGSITSPAIALVENPTGYPHSFNYTPTTTNFTVGNGTVTGKFSVKANKVSGFLVVTLGSTSSVTGGVSATLPGGTLLESANVPIGTASFVDTGSAQYSGIIVPLSDAALFKRFVVSGTAIQQANLSSSTPFTWGSTDYMTASFTYSF